MVFDQKNDNRLISTDLLTIRGHEEHTPKDYNLEFLIEEKQYFILSPKDIVLGKPRDEDDHIEWMLQHEEFEKALEQTQRQQKLLRKFTYLDVGKKYLDHLLKTEQFGQASVLCTKILGRDKTLWETEIVKFMKLNQLKVIAPYVPCGDHVTLAPEIYETILYDFLKTDPEGFLKFIRLWPSNIYNLKAVANVVIEVSLHKIYKGCYFCTLDCLKVMILDHFYLFGFFCTIFKI